MAHVGIVQELFDDASQNPTAYENQPRQRLRSWLTDQLDSGNCPGCGWINKDLKIFKLTWKHYGRPGFDEDRDAKIFREWARHTKRYSPGDPPDVSTWKTRFRNALHKMPDIEEMAGHHQLDGNDPYRVYRFRTPEEMDRIRKAQTTNFATMPPSPYVMPEPGAPYCPTGNATKEIDKIKQFLIDQNEVPQMPQNRHLPTFNDEDFDDIEKILMKEMAPNKQMKLEPMECQQMQNAKLQPPNNIPITAIGIKLFFSEKEVGSLVINTPHGVRIAYEPPPPVPTDIVQEDGAKEVLSNIYGPLEAHQVYYPYAEDDNSQKMLNWIRRGLVIEVKPNGDIYATRLCQAKVFYSNNTQTEPNELRRSQQTLVFSFYRQFLPGLSAYQNGQPVPPSCEMYFSFGQKWSYHEPLKEVLIHCSVTHFFSKKLFKDAKANKPIEQLVSSQNPDDVLKERMEKIALADAYA